MEREEVLRGIHSRLRSMQVGGAVNVAHDIALREMLREVERKLARAAGPEGFAGAGEGDGGAGPGTASAGSEYGLGSLALHHDLLPRGRSARHR